MTRISRILIATVVTILLQSSRALACACGCNAFTVGTMWNMPTTSGFSISLHYDYMNQSQDWGAWHHASPEVSDDKDIRTSFYTLGFQYMPTREWGFMVEAPVWDRYFETIGNGGKIAAVDHTSLGDVRITSIYTGLSEDMSTGLQFGVKLATGPTDQSLMDRDTQIGSGSTDLLLGGYRMGQENGWGWYGQVVWQHAFNSHDGYRPGDDLDLSTGIHYDRLLEELRIIPLLHLVASFRGIDNGPKANPGNTGYERVFVSPGVELVASGNLRLFGDWKIPIVTHVRGHQLVAPALFSVTMGYDF